MLNIAVKAARRAGQIINRASFELEGVQISPKQGRDFVTEIDHAAEAAIIDVLMASYPRHGILAEESGAQNPNAEYQWIIDPLDGTINFIHGIPQYAVSIGLIRRGVPTQAVVFDPNRNELFTASRGVGAYLNDRRIRVTARDYMSHCVIGTGFPFRAFHRMDQYLAILQDLSKIAAGLRRPGAASLDLAWVACGRFDGFFELGLAPWDMAAGILLVTEAGGLIGDWRGEPDFLKSGDLLAANPKVYDQMLRIIEKNPPPATPAAEAL